MLCLQNAHTISIQAILFRDKVPDEELTLHKHCTFVQAPRPKEIAGLLEIASCEEKK